jgi:peptidoglycan hydrolase-like protein with peptidoglycan-binding domain
VVGRDTIANKNPTAPSKVETMRIWLGCLVAAVACIATVRADSSIAEIQQRLKEQGFYYGELTGKKDADTTAAVRRYQIRNGLQITGELNDETLNSIRSSQKNTTQTARVAPARTPLPQTEAPESATDPAPPVTARNRPAIQPAQPPIDGSDQPNMGRPILSGSSLLAGTPYQTAPVEVQRKVIADAQRILARRGLFREEIDGAYGPALEFSLRAYQSRVGLPATGRLDLETLAALELLPGPQAPFFAPRRPAAPRQPIVRGEWVRP